MLESVRNSAIYSVSSCIYYQYFTVKDIEYTRNIFYLLIYLQIQRNIYRKLRITIISSSQWNVVNTFWVIWGNVRCSLMKPLILGDYTKIITHFILHFSKIFLFRLLSSTIKRDYLKSNCPYLVYWTMKNQWDFIPDLMKLFYTLYFSLKIYFNCVGNSLAFFHF